MPIELLILIGGLLMLRYVLLKRQEQQIEDDEYEYYDEANDCWPSERSKVT